MFEVAVQPRLTVSDAGFDAMEKSCTVKATVAWWDKPSPDAVTVTVYVPYVENVHDSVEVPDATTLLGLRLQPLSADRFTVSGYPLIGETVIVEVAGVCAITVTEVGL